MIGDRFFISHEPHSLRDARRRLFGLPYLGVVGIVVANVVILVVTVAAMVLTTIGCLKVTGVL